MTSIIFIHGTGGRGKAYGNTFYKIEKKLNKLRPEFKLVDCLWGDVLGTKLKAAGASIPDYNSTGGKANLEQDYSIELWEQLYQDPLYEIRLLSLNRSQKPKLGDPWQELKKQFDEAGIAKVVEEAREFVTGEKCEPYSDLLQITPESLDECYSAISRAIVAQAITLEKQKGNYPLIRFDRELRDRTVESIYEFFTQQTQEKGVIGDFIKNRFFLQPLKQLGTKLLQEKRGILTDRFYPFIGDIILYQAKGERICDFIKNRISEIDSLPVILLAHSLGGIACVELLIKYNLPKVKLLITVGSQAPFFYELDALQSLSNSERLPEHFPQWLNIYDRRDILSYIGDREGLFPGRVEDVEVDNQQPFPEAHSAYWYTESTWKTILEKISRISQ